ncbi:MAG: MFS transporter [Deltaproteobacteria bacterium]|nr:MAG: MFS transporter [Deltaproteobacteria bacterium]
MTPSLRHRWVIPWLMACALFMETLDVTIISTVLPEIAQDLHVTAVSLKLALTAYLLSLAVFIPISGWMAERFGARRVFASAIAIFTLGSALCGAASSLPWLVVARLIQGLGGAMMLPVSRLILMRSFPKADFVRVTNYATVPALLGPALGPLVGGIIATHTTWRWVFYVNLPFGAIGLALTLRYLPRLQTPSTRTLDRRGFVLFGLGLAGLSFGFESIGESYLTVVQQLLLLGLAAACMAWYVHHAARCAQPFLRLQLLDVSTFRVTLVGSLLGRLGIGGVPFLLPLMFQLGMHMSPLRSGALVMPIAAAMILMKFFVKPILTRWGFRRVLLLNTLLLGASIAQFALIDASSAPWSMVAVAFCYGLLASLQFSCMNVLTFVDIKAKEMGDAASISSTVQQFATSLGVAVSALALGLFTPAGQEAGLLGAFHHAFVCVGVITMLSSYTFASLRPDAGSEASGHRASRSARVAGSFAH